MYKGGRLVNTMKRSIVFLQIALILSCVASLGGVGIHAYECALDPNSGVIALLIASICAAVCTVLSGIALIRTLLRKKVETASGF